MHRLTIAFIALLSCAPATEENGPSNTNSSDVGAGCVGDQVLTELEGFDLEDRAGEVCISRNRVPVGQFCMEAEQYHELVDNYTNGKVLVLIEPQNLDAIAGLQEEGFEKVEGGQWDACETLDAQP